MITIVTPNEMELPFTNKQPIMSIFLAGTIDNGDSNDWQTEVINKMQFAYKGIPGEDTSIGDILVYNPRRRGWKPNATQKDVEEQIRWEQEHLDKADYIFMYLDDNSKSPISLLELGLYAQTAKLIVFCTGNFYRYTNVRMTCDKYEIPLICTNDCQKVVNEIKRYYDAERELHDDLEKLSNNFRRGVKEV